MKGPRSTTLAIVAAVGLVAAGCAGGSGSEESRTSANTVTTAEVDDRPAGNVIADDAPSVVDVTVVAVAGDAGGDLAGVVTREADGMVVGGFATRIDGDPFTTTQRVLRPGGPDEVSTSWPHLSDEAAEFLPGAYVLSLWSDTGLSGASRWVPMNTDGAGLAGCVAGFVVGDDDVTEVVVGGDVRSTGVSGGCVPVVVPGDPDRDPIAAEVVTSEPVAVTPPLADVFDGAGFGIVEQALVWRDEFLVIGRTEPVATLPSELPAEIAEQFPEEILDLFPDGLPTTVAEAIVVIEEAGMMDEVTAAIDSIPGAREAILPDPPSTWWFARSPDGIVWEAVEATMPDGMTEVLDAAASDDRVVVVGWHRQPDQRFGPSEVTVAWSDDMVTWTTASMGPERPADLPDTAVLAAWDATVEANGSGWMVTAHFGLGVGDEELPADPSPEVARYLHDGGWGWAPLPTRWFSPWSDELVVTEPVDPDVAAVSGGVTVATTAGFVHVADAIRFTDDGTTWTTQGVLAVEPAPNGWRTLLAQPLPDGFVLVFDTPSVPLSMTRFDARGESWVPIGVPGLPPDAMAVSDDLGYLLNAGVRFSDGFEPWIIATSDGRDWFVQELGPVDPADVVPSIMVLNDDVLLYGSALSTGSWSVVSL